MFAFNECVWVAQSFLDIVDGREGVSKDGEGTWVVCDGMGESTGDAR
jgi:hypothetical protein